MQAEQVGGRSTPEQATRYLSPRSFGLAMAHSVSRRVAPIGSLRFLLLTYARQPTGCGGCRQEVGFAGCVLAPTVFLLRGSSRWSSQPGRARSRENAQSLCLTAHPPCLGWPEAENRGREMGEVQACRWLTGSYEWRRLFAMHG